MWLTCMTWAGCGGWLGSPKCIGQARLAMQGGVDIAVLSPQSIRQAIRQGYICYSLEVEFLLLWETSVLLLRPSTDWMRHIIKSIILYLKSLIINVHQPNTFNQ